MSRLNYHHLYYFYRVAERGNLTQTAKNLHISQSALSNQIKQLELAMETELFSRVGKRLVLTEAGTRAFLLAGEIFQRGEELERLLREGETGEQRVISIGISSYMSRNFIEELVEPVVTDPDTRIVMHTDNLSALLERLARHELDLVLSNKPIEQQSQSDWIVQLLSRQPVSVLCPPELKQEEFDQASWVLPSRYHAIRSEFDAYCQARELQPRIKMEIDDMAMMRLMARDHSGFSLVPSVVNRDELASGKLIERHRFDSIFERFYAVRVPRVYEPPKVASLLKRYASYPG